MKAGSPWSKSSGALLFDKFLALCIGTMCQDTFNCHSCVIFISIVE